MRRSELEAQIKTFYSFSKTKTPHSNFRKKNREPLLFTVLALSLCDFCFAPILLSEQALRATVDLVFHLADSPNFFGGGFASSQTPWRPLLVQPQPQPSPSLQRREKQRLKPPRMRQVRALRLLQEKTLQEEARYRSTRRTVSTVRQRAK